MAVPDAEPPLMPVPDGHATLMPIPDGAASPAATIHTDDMSGDGGMAGMDDHSGSASTMPSIATPDAPQRRLVLAGFAAANLLVIGAAAYMRRKVGKHRSSRATPPVRHRHNPTIIEGAE